MTFRVDPACLAAPGALTLPAARDRDIRVSPARQGRVFRRPEGYPVRYERAPLIPLSDDNPVDRSPIVTHAFVAINVAAFLLWQLPVGLQESVLRGGAIPFEILTFRDIGLRDVVAPPLTILTSMFLHGGWMHIGSNLLFLWIFGNNVEDALGRLRFVGFYVACGVAAALAQTLAQATTGDVETPMVGASGAIAGVLAAYMTLFPHARVRTLIFFFLIFIRELPAALLIGFWFAQQLLSVFFGGSSSGVAFMAHVGGFVAGLVLVRVLGRRATWRPRRVFY
jgi:membrane associated rhomboid family serine protease